MLFDIFVQTLFMYCFHERFSSISAPRNLVTFSLSTTILFCIFFQDFIVLHCLCVFLIGSNNDFAWIFFEKVFVIFVYKFVFWIFAFRKFYVEFLLLC